jgi:hypothetical protein
MILDDPFKDVTLIDSSTIMITFSNNLKTFTDEFIFIKENNIDERLYRIVRISDDYVVTVRGCDDRCKLLVCAIKDLKVDYNIEHETNYYHVIDYNLNHFLAYNESIINIINKEEDSCNKTSVL